MLPTPSHRAASAAAKEKGSAGPVRRRRKTGTLCAIWRNICKSLPIKIRMCFLVDLIVKEAIRIAELAGKKIKEIREKELYEESLKYGYELVTTADLVSNEVIREELSKSFPTHNYISEEENQKDLIIHNPTWIVDPIDGTVGYANNQYQVAVSIAYAVENEVKVGVVYNPFLDELFYAMVNSGAYLNNKPIKVKKVNELSQCVVGTGFPHKRDNIHMLLNQLQNILPRIRDIRRLGSPALDICWVACGRLQGFYEGKLSPWDIAAAKCIAIEAGAKTGFYSIADNNIPDCVNGNNIIITSPGIFEEMLGLLKTCD